MTEPILNTKVNKRETRAQRRNKARDNKTLTRWRKRQRMRKGAHGTDRVLDH